MKMATSPNGSTAPPRQDDSAFGVCAELTLLKIQRVEPVDFILSFSSFRFY